MANNQHLKGAASYFDTSISNLCSSFRVVLARNVKFCLIFFQRILICSWLCNFTWEKFLCQIVQYVDSFLIVVDCFLYQHFKMIDIFQQNGKILEEPYLCVVFTDAEERLSAVLITPGQNSVQVFWTALPSVVAANVSAIRVELTLKPQPVHNRFFSTNEVMTQTLELTDTGTFADSVTIGDLVRGVEYEVAVKVIGQGGDEMTSLTTNLNFNTGECG